MRINRKISLFTVGLLLLVMLLGSTLSILNFRDNYRDALLIGSRGSGFSLLAIIEDVMALGLPLESLDGLDRRIERTLKENPHLVYIVIGDLGGKALFHSDPQLVGRVFNDPVMAKAIAADTVITQDYPRFDGRDYYDVGIPIRTSGGDKVGVIRLGFPVEVIQTKVMEAVWQAVAIFSASFFLLAVLILLCQISFQSDTDWVAACFL